MRNYLLLLFSSLTVTCMADNLRISVSNPINVNRNDEIVEINADEVESVCGTSFVVLDKNLKEVPYQITYDRKVIFNVDVTSGGVSDYTVKSGIPQKYPTKVCGKYYKVRVDDIAWENNLVGFRLYGPAIQNRGEHLYGYDIFMKRGTEDPVLESMYKMQTDPVNLKKIKELKKTDPKAAGKLSRSITYHVDHGYGMDDYAVGPTLGAGTAALIDETGKIYYPWCYKTYEILDNGPLRFTLKLVFGETQYKGKTITENRIITLDKGSQLNKTVVYYDGLDCDSEIATGIVLHNLNNPKSLDKDSGTMSYIDPTQHKGNGELYIGVCHVEDTNDMSEVLFPKPVKGAYGHLLSKSALKKGSRFEYYWGYAWDRAGKITSFSAWNDYLKDFSKKLAKPLKVKTTKVSE